MPRPQRALPFKKSEDSGFLQVEKGLGAGGRELLEQTPGGQSLVLICGSEEKMAYRMDGKKGGGKPWVSAQCQAVDRKVGPF